MDKGTGLTHQWAKGPPNFSAYRRALYALRCRIRCERYARGTLDRDAKRAVDTDRCQFVDAVSWGGRTCRTRWQ